MPPRPINPVVSGSGSSSSSSPQSTYPRNPVESESQQGRPYPEAYPRSRPPSRSASNRNPDNNKDTLSYDSAVSHLAAAKATPFTVSGNIPLSSGASGIALFFRSPKGVSYSMDFPIDIEKDVPPAFETLLLACKPRFTCQSTGLPERECLVYPLTSPLTTTLDLSSHPVIDTIRSVLFPTLSPGHYLSASYESLEILQTGGHMCPQRRAVVPREGKIATLILTLPVRFRGGALKIHGFEGNVEKYHGRGGRPGDHMEWTAFLVDCDHEVETVQKGCRVTLTYGIYLNSFNPLKSSPSRSLVLPSERFLDILSPILNMSRGRRIGFYLVEHYGLSPSETFAEAIVPHLKGGDALLFHALKLYKLSPEIYWTSGKYIWPADCVVSSRMHPNYHGRPPTHGMGRTISQRFHVGHPSDTEEEELGILQGHVEDSGAIPLIEAGISIIPEKDIFSPKLSKEKVLCVTASKIEKLLINTLLVVYVK